MLTGSRELFLDIRAEELLVGFIRLSVGAAIATLVYRSVARFEWPRPFRWHYAALHFVAGPLAAATWLAVSTALEYLIAPAGTDLRGFRRAQEFMTIGTFVYVPIAIAAHAARNAERAARAEALAARTQLAALRAQLQPHFLFNALHTVVQLIPIDPGRAADAAERVGDLLRAALGEQRDEVPLADEWRFVSRYLDLERIRFGDRLVVRTELPDSLLDDLVPSFALQTLVENAVIHGAAPRVDPTEIVIGGSSSGSQLVIAVRNSGDGESTKGGAERPGTGLARLRERLAVLYGSAATLTAGPGDGGGYEALLSIPRRGDQA